MNYVVTGFDESYWKNWGSSWVYSLREIAGYREEVIVIDCGLSSNTINKLKEKEVRVVENKENENIKLRTLKTVSTLAKESKGIFIYWDADVFFESKIDDIFKEASSKIILSKNKNFGLIGGPNYQWAFIEDVIRFNQLVQKKSSTAGLSQCLIENFQGFINYVSNTWNFVGLNELSERKLEIDGERPKVIHPTGGLKYSLERKGFLFHERKIPGYLEFLEKGSSISRKLIKKANKN